MTKLKAGIIGAVALSTVATVLVAKYRKPRSQSIAHMPWADVGSATPAAALQTLLWATSNHRVDRAKELMQWDINITGPKSASIKEMALVSIMTPWEADINSFQITAQVATGQDELTLNLKESLQRGVDYYSSAKVRRVGKQWHVVGKIESSDTVPRPGCPSPNHPCRSPNSVMALRRWTQNLYPGRSMRLCVDSISDFPQRIERNPRLEMLLISPKQISESATRKTRRRPFGALR